jgi:ferredoxin
MKRRFFLAMIPAVALAAKTFAADVVKAVKKPALIDQKKCVKCGTCFKNCPVKAITKTEKEGKPLYEVDPKKCISCGTCIKNCPVKAIAYAEVASADAASQPKTEAAPAVKPAATGAKK